VSIIGEELSIDHHWIRREVRFHPICLGLVDRGNLLNRSLGVGVGSVKELKSDVGRHFLWRGMLFCRIIVKPFFYIGFPFYKGIRLKYRVGDTLEEIWV